LVIARNETFALLNHSLADKILRHMKKKIGNRGANLLDASTRTGDSPHPHACLRERTLAGMAGKATQVTAGELLCAHYIARQHALSLQVRGEAKSMAVEMQQHTPTVALAGDKLQAQ
jgi:hypothetical protein